MKKLNKKGVVLFFSLLLLIGGLGIFSAVQANALPWKTGKEIYKEVEEGAYKLDTGRDELPPETIKKKEVKQGGVVLKNKEYPLEHYQGLSTASDLGKTSFIGFSNGIFWLDKFFYQGIDYGINLMSSQTIIGDWTDTTLGMAKALWTEAKKEYLVYIVIIVGLVFIWQAMAMMDIVRGLKTVVCFVGVFLLATFFFNHGGTVIKETNAVNENMQGSVLKVGTFLSGMSEEIPEDQTKEGVTAMIRNTYFNLAVLRPYLLMNYGTTNEEALLKNDPKRLDKILKLSRSSLYEEKLKAAVKNEAGEGKNDYMSDSDLGVNSKFGMSLGSLILVLGVGIPLLILALANFLVQIMILACILVLAISFFVSMIPQFRQSFVKPLTKVFGLIVSQSFLVIFLLFVLLIMTILDSVISPDTSGGFVVNSIVLGFILWYLLKNRDELVSMITGGRVQLQTKSAGRLMNSFQWGSNWVQNRGLRKSFERGQNKPTENKENKKKEGPPRFRLPKNQSRKRQLPNEENPTRNTNDNPRTVNPKSPRRVGQSKRSKSAPPRRSMGNRQSNKPSELRKLPIQKKRPITPRPSEDSKHKKAKIPGNKRPSERRHKKTEIRTKRPTQKRKFPEEPPKNTKQKQPIKKTKQPEVPIYKKTTTTEPKQRPSRNERRRQ
jgi:hypothetical protein